MTNYEPLTDLQWQLLEPLFPNPVKRTRGKPHTPWRSVVNSIFYVLFMGLKWGSLPKDPAYATKSAAHRWFVLWEKNGFLKQIVETYQNMTKMGSDIKLPRRRNRLPAAKRILETAAAS
jgi:transposase